MALFILRRLMLTALMLFGLVCITFVVSNIAPSDPAALAAGPDATRDMVETIRREYGLDRPLPEGAGGDSLAQCIERDACARATALAGLKRGWAGRADEMQRWLETQWQRKDCTLDRRVLGPANGRRWIEARQRDLLPSSYFKLPAESHATDEPYNQHNHNDCSYQTHS